MRIDSKEFANYTDLVTNFYDEFPYPDLPIIEGPPLCLDWRFSLENVYSECIGAISPSLETARSIRILDAGCGSGVSTNCLSYLNSGAEIVAIDISSRSLKCAKKRICKSSIDNNSRVHFQKVDLLNFKSNKGFDYINSIGLLNHIKDPLEGFIALSRSLNKDGIIHLFIYSEYGRYRINLINQIFRILGLSASKNDISLARELINSLPNDNLLKNDFQLFSEKEYISDCKFADMYLHPFETNFTLDKVFNLLDLSGLRLLGFSNKRVWRIERLLCGKLLEKANLLGSKEKFKLIEKLDPSIDGFDIFLAKKNFKVYKWTSDAELFLTKGKVNSLFVNFEENIFLDQDMQKTHISDQEIDLLKRVRRNPGKPLQSLTRGLEQGLSASLLRKLWQKKMLLLYPL